MPCRRKNRPWVGEGVQLHGAQDAPRPWYESPQVRTVTQGCLYLLCPGLCSVCGPPLGQLCVWPATCVPVRLFDAATWDPPGEVARLHCAVLPHSPILAAWRGVEPLQLGSPVNRYVAKDMPTHISTQGGFETLALGVRHHRLVGGHFPLDTVRRNYFSEHPVRRVGMVV